MRAAPKVPLQLLMKHSGDVQPWRVDKDMTIAYLIKAIAMEEEIDEKEVLIMRGTHIPGAEGVYHLLHPNGTCLPHS